MNQIKLLLAVLLLAVLAACSHSDEKTKHERIDISTVSPDDSVWICTSSGAKRFHASDTCKGLSNCGEDIIRITRDEAEFENRTFCHKCYTHTKEKK